MLFNSGGVVSMFMPKTKKANKTLATWSAKDVSKGSRVLLRVDANIPLVHGEVDEHNLLRIRAAVPEIQRLLKRGARVIIATHLGRPHGRHVSALSTSVLANAFARELGSPVRWIAHVVGRKAEFAIARLKPGSVAMLENLRFEQGEEKNDEKFAQSLARLADVYVNNAFGVCHERHASVHAVTKYLPSFAGELLLKEVRALRLPAKRPLVVVVGGAKIESKIPMLHKLGRHADAIIIGGGAALTFIAAAGGSFGFPADEFTQRDDVAEAKMLLRYYGDKIVLPRDLVASRLRKAVIDIGARSLRHASHILAEARTIVWNGPMGITEEPDGCFATLGVAWAIASNTSAYSIVGGGETVTFVESTGLIDRFSHVSTGGGAMLAFLADEPMPGIRVLEK
ncbi:MAG: Phosphoglycerate kinase [Candidatus Uhrbacteria bacterium GW2011_GWD2_52_7]|uniref:Phosphoglycerate kinase n=1 Tax=Candidatus Uhrbacteria bacterium GW2011_GWD2_52_7 TaxID=1618989 RepID=A0A0G1ZQ99_9BACT|nr:MAG: Phosphoglycerate kinase [Candidatus Uhrbacteria bacterium GW2011_GWD2_52_7]